ncbi:F-box protein: endocytic membrane traffic, recycling ReCYcling 1 [Marasmius tenuissimus]|nr:F-box protein: endocytic membrane traffic, recycling ReCYcling 1 [Marasmius tenuissimus]
MDKFATLQPTRLYNSVRGIPAPKPAEVPKLIGRLPTDIHLLILLHLPVPDFLSYSLTCRAAAELTRTEKIWESRWNALSVEKYGLQGILDELDAQKKTRAGASRAAAPPTIAVDDDFGDFASGDLAAGDGDEMGDFIGAGGFDGALAAASATPKIPSLSSDITFLNGNSNTSNSHRSQYIRTHCLLKPLTKFLNQPPHVILSSLETSLGPNVTIRQQALALCLLSSFLSPQIKPVRQWSSLYSSLRSAMDRFDANLLAAFDLSDGKSDEVGMREAAESSWLVWASDHTAAQAASTGGWEMGKVWAEKREIFYESKGNPMDNFNESGQLAFDAMDEFMKVVRDAILEHGSRAVRVFPPASQVLVTFSERIANEVVSEYISSLLLRAREISTDTYLKAVAATFKEAWRMVDAILLAAATRPDTDNIVSRTRAEDVVYQMFEQNMDEYLDEEIETVKLALEKICKSFDKQMSKTAASSGQTQGRFLASHNPAQVKRNVLASFTDVLLLPVTIVPRTVGAVGGAIVSGGKMVTEGTVQGIAMLNPVKWGAGSTAVSDDRDKDGYLRGGSGDMVFEIGEESDDEDEKKDESQAHAASESSTTTTTTAGSKTPSLAPSTAATSVNGDGLDQMDLLLSLDAALELIHTDREALKRVETFAGYPGHYGHRVRDTIEEVFILMLNAMGEGHVNKGFTEATSRMTSYKPADHDDTTSVAPLVQFFELVHVGDTIQSMVQVYFDKELAPHIDRTDFLNAVVREKKRFENALDDCVAGGLNAGTELLMNQVEHIINKFTKPREYYPPEGAALDLGPTQGCTEAIKCLEMHCNLLKGSTSKEVLEVFHQEVGIRLIAILQKHIKRQIISLNGGFQVIADLNTYHAFITSLKVPSIAADFSHLKMLGHVYVVEDAKDLAQIVRDVTRYGGAYRPEDVYEFIQRRSDWKKIEKTVDKTMYNLSFKEDCVVC